MREGDGIFTFCCAEADSLYAMNRLRDKREKGSLSPGEARQLVYMEKRTADGNINLLPAVIFAAACQDSCRAWLDSAAKEQRQEWFENGLSWLRHCPSFLEKFGWRSRRSAVMAAGLFAGSDCFPDANQRRLKHIRSLLSCGWSFLWTMLEKKPYLTAEGWEVMLAPWEDSVSMKNGMAGVILLMANIQNKQVLDRDRLWRSLRRLKAFSEDCLRPSGLWSQEFSVPADREQEDMTWLLSHFRNPQRPAYIREKGRMCSEWLERLYQVMELAGLPASVCEEITLSGSEVRRLLELMEDKKTERQYMTFLLLYAVSRELAAAGISAAAGDIGA